MVRTIVHTTEGPLEFQDYFLHWQSAPKITGFTYKGIEAAKPTPDVLEALTSAKIILIGPSNPFVSIAPILALSGVRDILKGIRAPVVALTPIVGGRALKGPAARMLREMGYGVSALGVAGLYRDFLDGFVLDVVDADICREVEASGIRCLSTDTVMQTLRDRKRVAQQMVAFARRV
jgi:LPPG:FO 2-phospho-L-lactate transferase